ncbi:MAG: hypothetical protein IJ789_00780 [Bacteroidales bacterium]|nr:hypothetical protein [Bacteroidales bacterium]
MKRKLLLALNLIILGLGSASAQSPFATLQHGDNLTVYYGTGAFTDANAAAANGDIITLSPGHFVCDGDITISKAITIRGAGMSPDTAAGTFATTVRANNNHTIHINVPGDSNNVLQIVGINFSLTVYLENLSNATFEKCIIMPHGTGAKRMCGCVFTNCLVSCSEMDNSSLNTFINSFVNNKSSNSDILVNCIYTGEDLEYGTYRNCIITYGNYLYTLPSSDAQNCLFITKGDRGKSTLSDELKVNNYEITGEYGSGDYTYNWAGVFKKYDGSYTIYTIINPTSKTFELTDEAKSRFHGNDGTEVGVNGGLAPFNHTVLNYKITVPQSSTTEGNLDINVEKVN